MRQVAVVVAIGSLALFGCSDDADTGGSDDTAASAAVEADDRELFGDELDGVSAVVADCFVVEVSDGTRRYQTTIEVDNGSEATQTVAVTVVADLGRGGVSDSFEVPAGARDAWAVTADEATTDPAGDVECAAYVEGIEITLGTS